MKTIVYLFACGMIILACSSPEEKQRTFRDSMRDTVEVTDTAEYALSVDSARIYVHRYDSIAKAMLSRAGSGDTIPIRAYTIRAVDLLEALGMPPRKKSEAGFEYVRVYLGLDFDNKFRLFLTPVRNAHPEQNDGGKDVILKGPHTRGSNNLSAAVATQGTYVMDFVTPCPTACDKTSPLYGDQ